MTVTLSPQALCQPKVNVPVPAGINPRHNTARKVEEKMPVYEAESKVVLFT